MASPNSDLAIVLARLAADPDFFAECRLEIRGKQGDEAILALMNFASRHGYAVTFQQTSIARRKALQELGAPSEVLKEAVTTVRGEDVNLQQFLKQW